MGLKPEFKFGILAGFALIMWTMVQYWLGFHTFRFKAGQITGYGMYFIIAVALWMGLNEKYADNGGTLSVRNGMKSGILQLMLTAVVATTFMIVYDYKINAHWIDQLVAWQKETQTFGLYVLFDNDPNSTSIILSNSETHICVYFLGILGVGGCIAFLIAAILASRETTGKEIARESI